MNSQKLPLALVVDDEVIILLDMAYIIQDAGFQVYEAMSADMAKELLLQSAQSISLLVCDIDMPGTMNGLDLAHYVADHWPWIEIVLTSGRRPLRSDEMPDRATFFGKPFSTEQVHAHLQQHLPQHVKALPPSAN